MRTVVSSSGYAETVGRALDALSKGGLTLFAQIDHAAAAREVGQDLAPEVVLVFGNPRAGTALMQADPRIGIELPLRLLVWERDGETIVGYDDPRDLAAVYDVDAQAGTLETMATLLERLSRATSGSEVAS